MIYSKLVMITLNKMTTINPTKVDLIINRIEDEKAFWRGVGCLLLNKLSGNFISKHIGAKGIIE